MPFFWGWGKHYLSGVFTSTTTTAIIAPAAISSNDLATVIIKLKLRVHDNSLKDTSSNTTFGRIRQLVECNVWSKWTVGLNLYFVEMCLKFV